MPGDSDSEGRKPNWMDKLRDRFGDVASHPGKVTATGKVPGVGEVSVEYPSPFGRTPDQIRLDEHQDAMRDLARQHVEATHLLASEVARSADATERLVGEVQGLRADIGRATSGQPTIVDATAKPTRYLGPGPDTQDS